MAKTKIEWTDYSVNPVKGLCPVACPYCYARRMYKRFHWNPNIRADWQETGKIPNKPSRIFVGSTMELFGEWVKPEWMREIFNIVKRYPQHTFIFLTKKPENLIKWSPFPSNVWVGISATNQAQASAGCAWLSNVKASVKFLSVEPLLEWNVSNANNGRIAWQDKWRDINWLIIGQCTPVLERTRPNPDWVRYLITYANNGDIPVFVKDNIIDDKVMDLRLTEMRQEFPRVK